MAQAYAAQHGLELDTSLSFQDLGVSAYRGANAEAGQLGAFLEAVRAGLVPRGSYLLVEALDRLSRLTPRKALRVLESVVEEDITVVTLADGKVWTAAALDEDPTALLIAVVLMLRANEESATKARRLASAWSAKRALARDLPLTSVVPAWIELDRSGPKPELRLVPDRAAVVRRIFSEALAGRGQQLIAGTLNREAVPCFGKAEYWRQTYIRKILSNPASYGVYVPHRYVHSGSKRTREPLAPIEGYYPAAVSKEIFDAVQAQKSTATTPRGKSGKPVNLLGGLATCPLCGSTVTRVNKGSASKGRAKLVCTRAKAGMGCTPYYASDYAAAEHAILAHAEELAHKAPAGDLEAEEELERLLTGVDEMQHAVGRIVEALERGHSKALMDRLRRLEEGLREAESRRDELLLSLEATAGPVLAKRLETMQVALLADPLDPARANAALRTVLRAVVVDWPTGVLRFQWKQGGESELHFAMPVEIALQRT